MRRHATLRAARAAPRPGLARVRPSTGLMEMATGFEPQQRLCKNERGTALACTFSSLGLFTFRPSLQRPVRDIGWRKLSEESLPLSQQRGVGGNGPISISGAELSDSRNRATSALNKWERLDAKEDFAETFDSDGSERGLA